MRKMFKEQSSGYYINANKIKYNNNNNKSSEIVGNFYHKLWWVFF